MLQTESKSPADLVNCARPIIWRGNANGLNTIVFHMLFVYLPQRVAPSQIAVEPQLAEHVQESLDPTSAYIPVYQYISPTILFSVLYAQYPPDKASTHFQAQGYVAGLCSLR